MNIHDFKKPTPAKICVLTCYDYASACMIAESQVPCVLVGDSLAMVVHGLSSTIMATIEMMVLHTQAVARGLTKQFLISDLPFLSHKISREHTLNDVKKLMQAGAHAIKIEGADENTCATIAYLVQAGIPVMGHIGLTPQSIHQLGGYKVQGKNKQQADTLVQQAKALQEAGCFALVIECVPQALAKSITDSIAIPTIGIGAGPDTDGQVLVWHDMLGMNKAFNPKFVKQFAQANTLFVNALDSYVHDVHAGTFPGKEHTY